MFIDRNGNIFGFKSKQAHVAQIIAIVGMLFVAYKAYPLLKRKEAGGFLTFGALIALLIVIRVYFAGLEMDCMLYGGCDKFAWFLIAIVALQLLMFVHGIMYHDDNNNGNGNGNSIYWNY